VDRLHAELALRPARVAPAVLLLLLALFSPSACSKPALVDPTFESDTALARAVLDRLERKDAEGLLALSVTRDEFEDLVWPTLPISRPEVNMPFDYVWQDNFTKSRAYLGQTLADFGGRHYDLEKVEFAGEETDYGTFTVHRETRLFVRDSDGQEQTMRIFGSIIRQNGRSKVFSYIVD
jgi:hypothetical protein